MLQPTIPVRWTPHIGAPISPCHMAFSTFSPFILGDMAGQHRPSADPYQSANIGSHLTRCTYRASIQQWNSIPPIRHLSYEHLPPGDAGWHLGLVHSSPRARHAHSMAPTREAIDRCSNAHSSRKTAHTSHSHTSGGMPGLGHLCSTQTLTLWDLDHISQHVGTGHHQAGAMWHRTLRFPPVGHRHTSTPPLVSLAGQAGCLSGLVQFFAPASHNWRLHQHQVWPSTTRRRGYLFCAAR